MLPFRLSVATRHFAQPLPTALKTAGQNGFRGVQLEARQEFRPHELSETGRRQFLHQLTEQLLAVSALEFPTRRAFYDQDALDARVAGLKAALDAAYQMKAGLVVGRVGRIPEDAQSDKYRLLVDVLNDVAQHSNRIGANFAITPTADAPDVVQRLLNDVTTGPLMVNLDLGGLAMNGINPTQMLSALHDRIAAVQVRDGLRDIDGLGQEVVVGRGEVMWDEVLALLHESGYRGWLTVTRSAGDDRIGDAVRAAKFLQQVAAR